MLGSKDFALHEAQTLSHTAAKVTILTNGETGEFSSEVPFETVEESIEAILGEEAVEGVRLAGGRTIPVSGLFVAIGNAGSSEIARQMGAELSDKGHIKVNEDMESSIPGLFAAGDCTGGLLQVAKAVSDGAHAGLSALKYVRKRG